jgi:hypothetical protein
MRQSGPSINPVVIKKHSGRGASLGGGIEVLREGFFIRDNRAVSGDAPKDFLRIYEFGRGRKANPRTWPAHIAKVGHKCYPIESITEHLLTRVGEALGMEMLRLV